jgi:microcystin-dependent protein
MSFGFPPKGWAECNGQLLPINQNQALFSLLGTAYGGDGRVNFALPDLRGRVPLHNGGEASIINGERGGEESHTISAQEMPQHNHLVNADTTTASTTGGNSPGSTKRLAGSQGNFYSSVVSNLTPFTANEVTNAGGSQAHLNQQPYIALEICIALQGIFPSQN